MLIGTPHSLRCLVAICGPHQYILLVFPTQYHHIKINMQEVYDAERP